MRRIALTSGSRQKVSYYQWSFRVIGRLRTNMLYSPLPIASEKVEAQTIFILVHGRRQFLPERRPLGWVNHTLEHGILNALSMILADLGDMPQSFSALASLCIYIISYQNHHNNKLISKGMAGTLLCLPAEISPSALLVHAEASQSISSPQ